MAKKKTILIIEDNEAILDVIKIYVEYAGYKVLTALDGRTGLELAQKHKPDLVITDLMLPELHGVGVCHALKSDPATKRIKVMVVSAKNFPADHKQAAEAGADAFMSKPINEKDFLKGVEQLIGRDGKGKNQSV